NLLQLSQLAVAERLKLLLPFFVSVKWKMIVKSKDIQVEVLLIYGPKFYMAQGRCCLWSKTLLEDDFILCCIFGHIIYIYMVAQLYSGLVKKKAEDYRNSLQQEAQAKAQALHFEDELARKRMPGKINLTSFQKIG
ncbi:hypothetical protein ACJX0J_042244, partial [Zea mays]